MAGTSVYQMVMDRIINELEKGIIPWKKPWIDVRSGAFNRISRKPYSLLNQMLLKHQGEYASFKQWSDLGGKVKKGSKAEFVVFWKMQEYQDINENNETVTKLVPLLRYYNVFHISQVEGIEPLPSDLPEIDLEPIAEAEIIKENYKTREGLEIREIITNEAYYSPIGDYIKIPERKQYTAIEEFYSTLFHEMVHSTGHQSRLNRLESGASARFGDESYSKEELVAEIGSAMILNQLGIETAKTFTNSAAYISGWLEVLKNDNKFIVSASSKAEKAVEYILKAE